MKKKEDLRIVKPKKSLYEGLLIMMKDTSFEDIKVSDICNVSLVNRSTFYDHFSDKYELLISLIHDLEEELSEKLATNQVLTSAKDYYMSMIATLFQHISDNVEIYSSIIKNNNNGIASDMFRDAILNDVKKSLDNSSMGNLEVPVDIISTFYVSAVINVCIEYVRDPKKYTMEEILRYLDCLVPNDIYLSKVER